MWHHVNRVQGKSSRQVRDPDPADRARELVLQWRGASSLSGLPGGHQEALGQLRPQRIALLHHNVSLPDDICMPITHDELLSAVKRGKSTAPGKDGLTYDILNALLGVKEANPILDLFYMSLATGKLPPSWKAAIVVPIPKGDGTFRPISLTSCLCKMMERVILNRLIYKVGPVLSGNVHGFLKGHSTSHCFVECLINKDVTCRAFIDLKGAFDRANKDVIMEELIHKGIRGRLLGWIRDYLYNRTAQVWFQGAVSSEEVFELGTPQGGVLSPMLFNVLMDKIARWPFPQGTQVLIYADDILLQCLTPRILQEALSQLTALCVQMGLVINECKTKIQAIGRVCRPLVVNNVPLPRVHTHKYLGAQLSFKKSLHTVHYVRDLCLPRLAPLRVLANRGLGAGIPVLRMFYISVIRSLIDYAAPVLIQYSTTQLRPLELVQNEAMRIILGCPRTARIEVLRAELHLPSITCRIQEITCRTVSRMLCTGSVSLQGSLVSLCQDPRAPATPYLRKILAVLTTVGVAETCINVVVSPLQPTWNTHRVSVDVHSLPQPKRDWLPHVLQDMFMTKLSKYPHVQAVHVYCDGSVNGSKSGCGLFIRDYTSPSHYTDTEVSRRLPAHLSSTRAELYAVLEALHIVAPLYKDVYFFVDSQAALYALQSTSPTDCDIVNKCLDLIRALEGAGALVHFTWIPSHVGIQLNEKADRLAQCALQDDTVDPGTEYTLGYIKSTIKDFVHSSISDQLDLCCHRGSASSLHYVRVSQGCQYTYGRHSASQDVVAMRLRLGYKYFWEVSNSPAVCCMLCTAPRGHTLHHYVMDCPLIAKFRPQGQPDLHTLIGHLLDSATLGDILKEYPKFAPRL